MKLHNLETELLFDTRSAKVTDVTPSSSSIGTEENPVQPSVEAVRGIPLRDHSDEAQNELCGSPSTVDGGRRTQHAFIHSLAVDECSQVPKQRQIDGSIISKERRQGVPRGVSDYKGHC